MNQYINSISQHALDRYKQRCGIRLRDDQHALEKIADIASTAMFAHKDSEDKKVSIFTSKGWYLKVKKKMILTMFMQTTTKRKRFIHGNRKLTP